MQSQKKYSTKYIAKNDPGIKWGFSHLINVKKKREMIWVGYIHIIFD